MALLPVKYDNTVTASPMQMVFFSLAVALVVVCSEVINVLSSNNSLVATPFWLTSGLCLGLIFIFGFRCLPGILMGAFFSNLALAPSYLASPLALIPYTSFSAIILSVQTMAIFLWFQQWMKSTNPFENDQKVIGFLIIVGLTSTLASVLLNINHSVFVTKETISIGVLTSTWLANLSSILIITPLVLVISQYKTCLRSTAKGLEWTSWLAGIIVLSYVAFALEQNVTIFTIPFMIWAGTRFGQAGSIIAIAILSLLFQNELTHPASVIDASAASVFEQLIYPIFWAALVVTTIYFATLLQERKKVEDLLEYMVLKRTKELNVANEELKEEVAIREQAEKSLRATSKRYRTLIETAGIPIIVVDHHFNVRQWNTAAEDLFGYSRDDMIGYNFIERFVPANAKDETAWKFTKVIESGVTRENLECDVVSFDGATHTMLWNMNYLSERDEEEHGQLLLMGQNISEIRETQDQLHYLAHFDSLTGTANRRLFEDRCQQAMQSAIRHKHTCALISLDIDHFKRINDTLGHDAGDLLLVTLAERLSECVRKEDTIARLGGDEFAVLLFKVNGQEGAELVARNILENITKPMSVNGSELVITSSIGITLCPEDGSQYAELLKNADMAMYRAKKAGRNNIQFYSPEMNEEMRRQLAVEQDLRVAMQQDQMRLHYQPIIDIETGQIVALEALLRWIHPKKGMLQPEYFIQVAEQTGQLLEISEWIIRSACLHGSQINKNLTTPIQIAVNLSYRQYHHPGLINIVEKILEETQFNPRNLIFEMAESTVTANISYSHQALNALHRLGISLTLDCFGTGLSSLSQLKQIPIDIIKVDRTFVEGIPNDENNMAITETLLAVAHQMDLKTFATGIETREQEVFLKINGCRYGQGYLYSPPQPMEKIPQLFKTLSEGVGKNEGDQIYLPFS